jgi:Gpi18-like mannosyltransferase
MEILFSILFTLVLRVGFSLLPSFDIDMGTWLSWAQRLSTLGLASFYSDVTWTQYTPGYLYYLWLIGKLGVVNDLAIKIPIVIADLATGYLIWSLVKKINKKLALVCYFLYVLNPVVIFDGSVWGQIDGLLTLFLFTSAYFLIEKKNLILSVLFWSLAFLIKPQAIAVAAVFIPVFLSKNFGLKQKITAVTSGLMSIFLLSAPFFTNNPLLGLPNLVLKMSKYYSYTSVNAFNIWSWVGLWKSDATVFLGLSLHIWGVVFLSTSIILCLFIFRNKLDKKANWYLLFAILSLCFFLFPTKVHERYLFPFFAFLLTSAGLSKSRNLFAVYVVTSVSSFFNLYYPYAYYNKNILFSQGLYVLSESLAKIIGFVFLCTYFALLFFDKLPKIKLPTFSPSLVNEGAAVRLENVHLTKKLARMALLFILIFAFATRVFALNSPPNEYFDEVYHAFTAKVMMHSDANKAWEWWNSPPTGFAYEWTHPPLAKLGMVLGMRIFGENAFGYRIPGAILGVISVFLIYLITKNLFKDEVMALISTGIFSLDGLALVMSRIGMNDSYLLCFTLLSVYLFLRQKNFLSALSFGLAISSKWSAIWTIPILGIIWLRRKKKFEITNLWFLVLPFGIYLLTYLPMFLTGHDLTVWWEMQKQMWWYHTGLRATHAYSSSWWSWPFLIRPIYIYTREEIRGTVSRIYAMGNPLVFWFGFASVALSFTYSYIERQKNLAFVIFAYLVFFVPWALSPRIMFLYHYLPSIPFLAMATGYVLRRNIKIARWVILLMLVVFIYFYPHWAGLQVPLWLDRSYYWVASWR